ncbi:MAG: Nif3-like dinuclear metal center hexameric protein [Cyclobacteriaceae bacterium]
MTKIKDIIQHLEILAPTVYQESYDNSGVLTGDISWEVSGVLISIDATEAVIDEAVSKGCNLVISHHPIIFKGLRKLTGSNYVERTIIKAVKNDICLYAIHTNLDNVRWGVNQRIAEKIGLKNTEILRMKKDDLMKLETFVPPAQKDAVLEALFQSGAGQIGKYEECSFQTKGTGTFRGGAESTPFLGNTGEFEKANEIKLELIYPGHLNNQIITALKSSHPYEEVAYYVHELANIHQDIGAGMIGSLDEAIPAGNFLKNLKEHMNLKVIKHTSLCVKNVRKIAVCGGSGGFLLKDAIAADADVFITADMKYHEYFDADGRIIIADIGHYESEVFTKDLIYDILTKKFANFAVNLSETVTNPISYL